ncbi:hypothetical protein [Saccharothrix syringae]|uniref:Uncharacterized protein n=1 Tax=Saccharothrix syringae TaxID=103733 RepID=A0A5Q0GUG7_SACSY|nr:hypothetical protein [Saccharothrix syringae]QFZ17638.1 hypothetical protein EKG83_09225 [Saccharothrix syringae]
MTGADKGPTGDVGQYAVEQYQQQGGGGLAGLFATGLGNIVAATRAVVAASEAQALSVDPHAVDSMLRKLTEMQDALDAVQQRADFLVTRTPIGLGYAEEVGDVNAQLGRQVVGDIIPEMVKAITDLKDQIEKSRNSYQNTDEAKSQTLNNL